MGKKNMQEFIQDTARGAGEILRREFGSVRTWKTKEDRGDVVTEADLRSEGYILSRITREFPDHNIVAEETGKIDISPESCTWFVDPLDGSLNFAMGIPLFSVSIAMACGSELQEAVVYDPTHDELFHATRGRGAFLNGAEMAVSGETDIEDAIISISWVRRRVDYKRFIGYVRRMSEHSSYYRRLGSAALILSYVASGRVDSYMQGGISPWDVAAGALLVQEAGGIVTDLQNRPLDLAQPKLEILAATPAIHAAMLEHVVGRE